MSNALAIASVTAVLKDLLDNALIDHSVSASVGSPVPVTALPPSRVKVGEGEQPQLNLFLYHVTPNQGWRNLGLPSVGENGERRTNPPLALDLHYLLTAYGKQDFEAEILLGYAMQMFHEMPVLTRDAIKRTLSAPSPVGTGLLPPSMSALKASDLADQVELIKISPYPMDLESESKLWTVLQANYRPSVAYLASVVLIESSRSSRTPPPVLTIGEGGSGVTSQPNLLPPYPALTEVQMPDMQVSARLGDTLTIRGHNLDPGPARFFLNNRRQKVLKEMPPKPGGTDKEILIDIPNDDSAKSSWPAGFYTLYAVFGSGKAALTTNELDLSLAPSIDSIDPSNKAALKVTFFPHVHPGQSASLALGNVELPATLPNSPTDNLTFNASSLPAGRYLARLRVDGVNSIFINFKTTPPSFLDSQRVDLP